MPITFSTLTLIVLQAKLDMHNVRQEYFIFLLSGKETDEVHNSNIKKKLHWKNLYMNTIIL